LSEFIAGKGQPCYRNPLFLHFLNRSVCLSFPVCEPRGYPRCRCLVCVRALLLTKGLLPTNGSLSALGSVLRSALEDLGIWGVEFTKADHLFILC